MRQLIARIQEYRFLSTLVSVLILIIVAPFFDRAEAGRFVVGVLFTLVLLSTVLAASVKRRQFIFALCLAIPWLFLNWGFGGPSTGASDIAANILLCIQIAFVIVLILSRILAEKEIEFDMLCGAIAVYLLLGVAWALAFSALERLVPGTFVLTNTGAQIDWTELLYFSFTTLTTLGYGDITPASAVARVWASLEAVTGVLYLAVLVARLVSLYRN